MIFNQYDTDTRDQTITNGPQILLFFFYFSEPLIKMMDFRQQRG